MYCKYGEEMGNGVDVVTLSMPQHSENNQQIETTNSSQPPRNPSPHNDRLSVPIPRLPGIKVEVDHGH